MTTLPRGREMTRADLDALPDDGWRHELVDGSLVMTAAPAPRHQRVAFELAVLLRAECPPDLEVMMAPVDVVLGIDTVTQPDVLVTRRNDLTERDLPAAPLLAVEVLSPSTRHIDLGLKLRRYETAGSPSYWVLDPGTAGTAERAAQPARLIAWELQDGAYVEVARVSGTQEARLERPFPVTVVPDRLVD